MSILLNRKSIRNYDNNFKIDKAELTKIFDLANRAPSSQNLQPTRIVVVESNEGKEKLKQALYGNHLQLETSSAMLVLFTDLNKYQHAEKILTTAVESGIMPLEVKEKQLKTIEHVKQHLTNDKILHDGIFDGGLYAMQLMLAAKHFGYDTCPIGGFNKAIINEILDVDQTLHPLLVISIGKANEEGFDSVRLPLDNIITFK